MGQESTNRYVVVIERPGAQAILEELQSPAGLRETTDKLMARLELGKPLRFGGDGAQSITWPMPGMRIAVFTEAEWNRRQSRAQVQQQMAVPRLVQPGHA